MATIFQMITRSARAGQLPLMSFADHQRQSPAFLYLSYFYSLLLRLAMGKGRSTSSGGVISRGKQSFTASRRRVECELDRYLAAERTDAADGLGDAAAFGDEARRRDDISKTQLRPYAHSRWLCWPCRSMSSAARLDMAMTSLGLALSGLPVPRAIIASYLSKGLHYFTI